MTVELFLLVIAYAKPSVRTNVVYPLPKPLVEVLILNVIVFGG